MCCFPISAGGNGNVLSCLEQTDSADTLAIVDGAAFGAMIESCLEYIKVQTNRRIALWMPESFEYLILKSGVISSRELEGYDSGCCGAVYEKESGISEAMVKTGTNSQSRHTLYSGTGNWKYNNHI